jgi:dihydrodipicolinate synthase/N-acetylneuraminate lyase
MNGALVKVTSSGGAIGWGECFATVGTHAVAHIINDIVGPFLIGREQIGADWTILQPPQLKGIPEIEIIRFFGAVAEHATKPVALQNNSVNLNVWLTNESLKTVNRNHPNMNILKGEGPIPVVQKLMEETDGVFDVFTDLGEREMTLTDALGCVGCIPAPDCIDNQCCMFELLDAGDKDGLKKPTSSTKAFCQ